MPTTSERSAQRGEQIIDRDQPRAIGVRRSKVVGRQRGSLAPREVAA
jgi:hypothetical protein